MRGFFALSYVSLRLSNSRNRATRARRVMQGTGRDVKAEPVALEETAASADGDGGGESGRRRTRACRRICLVLAMAAGLTLTAVGLIATPLDQDLDTSAAGAQSLVPTLQTRGAAFTGTPAVGALF